MEDGATPFLRAAQSGDLVLMKLLLEHGADPSIATDYNVTPLMVASGIGWVEGVTYEWSPQETLETVKFLLDHGANVNAQDTEDLRTALMGAAHKGRNDVVELLVRRGADLSLHDIGSRDTVHALAGVSWQAIDYADGLVRVGVQSRAAPSGYGRVDTQADEGPWLGGTPLRADHWRPSASESSANRAPRMPLHLVGVHTHVFRQVHARLALQDKAGGPWRGVEIRIGEGQ